MIVLGLDTATFTASAALVDAEGAVLAEGTLDTSGRGDDLLVLLDELCRTASVSPRQLAAVAVGAGPGSFTGLRIGMATAKGIAFAARSPLWLVSSLAAMAAELAAAEMASTASTSAGALWVPVLDARRGEVFAGFYRSGQDGELIEDAAEAVLAPEELVRRLAAAPASERSAVCAGDAIEVFAEPLAPLAPRWRSKIARTPSGAWIARLALRGERHDSLRSGRPAYLRPAEAEIMYPDGVPGAVRTLELPSTTQPAEKA